MARSMTRLAGRLRHTQQRVKLFGPAGRQRWLICAQGTYVRIQMITWVSVFVTARACSAQDNSGTCSMAVPEQKRLTACFVITWLCHLLSFSGSMLRKPRQSHANIVLEILSVV